MDGNVKNQLLQQFQDYLAAIDLPADESAEATDLYTVFSELSALRNEVKIESRQFKIALDDYKSVLELLRANQDTLNRELERVRSEAEARNKAALRALLLDYVDVYDRMAAGTQILANYRPTYGLFSTTLKQDYLFVKSVQEGQGMTLRRMEQLLAKNQVQPIEALLQPVDPHRMVVVEVDCKPDLANGVVIEELRKGFMWGEEVLRLAEVKVNKL